MVPIPVRETRECATTDDAPPPTADLRATIGAHLLALRRVLLRSLLALAIATIAMFSAAPWCFRALLYPAEHVLAKIPGAPKELLLLSLSPGDSVRLSVMVAALVGGALILPYVFLELWWFASPGLRARERRIVRWILTSGTALFVAGAAFAYFAVIPMLLQFFWEYSVSLHLAPSWTASYYIEFMLGNLAAFGVSFELPLVIALLAILGVVDYAWLCASRRYAYFLICVAAAILTPPDAVSMVMMAIPLLGLFELSLGVARVVGRKSRSEEDDT